MSRHSNKGSPPEPICKMDSESRPSPQRVARQHIQHGVSKRKSRLYYMHHRSAIKRRSKLRYRKVHNTGAFKRKLHHRHLHPGMHHRIRSASVPLGLPFWSPGLGEGLVISILGVTVTLYVWGRGYFEMGYEEFLDSSILQSEGDIDVFFQSLDLELGVDPLYSHVSDLESEAEV